LKKKRIPQQSGSPTNDTRGESGYEVLRAAVLEGAVFHADKSHGLAIVIFQGLYAWIRHCDATQKRDTSPAVGIQPYVQPCATEYLTTLIANLAEQGWKKKTANADNEGT
jgi:hypothetical protein